MKPFGEPSSHSNMIRRAFLLCAASTSALFAQNEGFSGKPLVRVDSDGNETKRTELSDEAGMKYQCRVVRKGKRYTWASRGGRELLQSTAGDWIYYISPEGSGYIKVYRGGGEVPFDYIEHLSSETKTVTYWGKRAG